MYHDWPCGVSGKGTQASVQSCHWCLPVLFWRLVIAIIEWACNGGSLTQQYKLLAVHGQHKAPVVVLQLLWSRRQAHLAEEKRSAAVKVQAAFRGHRARIEVC